MENGYIPESTILSMYTDDDFTVYKKTAKMTKWNHTVVANHQYIKCFNKRHNQRTYLQCYPNVTYMHLQKLSRLLCFIDGSTPSLHSCPVPKNQQVFFPKKKLRFSAGFMLDIYICGGECNRPFYL